MEDGTRMMVRFGSDTSKMVPVQFTNQYDKFLTIGGQQFNAGERGALTEEEAAVALREGAAVRLQSIDGYDVTSEKALTRSPHNKMVESAKSK